MSHEINLSNSSSVDSNMTNTSDSTSAHVFPVSGKIFFLSVAAILAALVLAWLSCLFYRRKGHAAFGTTAPVVGRQTRVAPQRRKMPGVPSLSGAQNIQDASDFIAKRMQSVRTRENSIEKARAAARKEQVGHLKRKLQSRGIDRPNTNSEQVSENSVSSMITDDTIERIQSVLEDERRIAEYNTSSKQHSIQRTKERQLAREKNRRNSVQNPSS